QRQLRQARGSGEGGNAYRHGRTHRTGHHQPRALRDSPQRRGQESAPVAPASAARLHAGDAARGEDSRSPPAVIRDQGLTRQAGRRSSLPLDESVGEPIITSRGIAVWTPRRSTPSSTPPPARSTAASSATRPSTTRRWRGSSAAPG